MMSELKEFSIEIEESDTGRRVILPNIKATDYEAAESYGNIIAGSMPVSEIDRQQGLELVKLHGLVTQRK